MPDLVFNLFNGLNSRDLVVPEDKLISCEPDVVNSGHEYSKGDLLVSPWSFENCQRGYHVLCECPGLRNGSGHHWDIALHTSAA